MEVPPRAEAVAEQRAVRSVPEDQQVADVDREFKVPQRTALKEQIASIDSWLEEDFSAREQLSKKPSAAGQRSRAPVASVADPTSTFKEAAAAAGPTEMGGSEAELFQKLEDVK